MSKRTIILLLTGGLFLSACNLPTPVPTMPATLPPPTTSPTMIASDTPAPSPSPTLIPSETPTPAPTATATITLTATPAEPMVTPATVDVNCRFGPSAAFLAIGALRTGQTVPILGTIADRSWWQIEEPGEPGTRCWVSASVTLTSGDISRVPVVAAPAALVTGVTVAVSDTIIHGYCHMPNPVDFTGTITTNGPATVVYHWEVYNEDGSLRNATENSTLIFSSYGTQDVPDPGVYRTDCGTFMVKLVVTSPNFRSAQASWKVVEP